MNLMAKKKSNAGRPATGRKGVPISLWIERDLHDQMLDYIKESDPKVTKRSIIESSLRRFFAAEAKK